MDLGMLQYTLGNNLDLLFIRIGEVRSRRWPFCRAMTTLIKTASRMCGEEKSPINKLTYGMFRPGKSKQPRLKCKAVDCRRLLPLILFIFRDMRPQEDELGVLHLHMLTQCISMYTELYKWKDTGSTPAETRWYNMATGSLYFTKRFAI